MDCGREMGEAYGTGAGGGNEPDILFDEELGGLGHVTACDPQAEWGDERCGGEDDIPVWRDGVGVLVQGEQCVRGACSRRKGHEGSDGIVDSRGEHRVCLAPGERPAFT